MSDVPEVTDGRALTTTRDREKLARVGDAGDKEHYEATSIVRRRVRENLAEDVELLAEHNPTLLEEIREVVCDE